MFAIFLKAKNKMLFCKEATLRLAKERVSEEFKNKANSFYYAEIYDQNTKEDIMRTPGTAWIRKGDECCG